MPINFVAIDFETANSKPDSACAVGAVVVRDGVIIDRRYSLINPLVSFSTFCTNIHGIQESTVKNAPYFEDIHTPLYKILNGQIFAAHNASFDANVLRISCENRNLAVPSITVFDSVEMSRKAWPELAHHRLNALCEYFQLPLKHHNAIEDATACALLILRCAEQMHANSLDELNKILANKAEKTAKKKETENKKRQITIHKARRVFERELNEN